MEKAEIHPLFLFSEPLSEGAKLPDVDVVEIEDEDALLSHADFALSDGPLESDRSPDLSVMASTVLSDHSIPAVEVRGGGSEGCPVRNAKMQVLGGSSFRIKVRRKPSKVETHNAEHLPTINRRDEKDGRGNQ